MGCCAAIHGAFPRRRQVRDLTGGRRVREDGTMKILRNHGMKIAAAAAFAAVAAALFLVDSSRADSGPWWSSLLSAIMATVVIAIIIGLAIVLSDRFDDWMESRREP